MWAAFIEIRYGSDRKEHENANKKRCLKYTFDSKVMKNLSYQLKSLSKWAPLFFIGNLKNCNYPEFIIRLQKERQPKTKSKIIITLT